MLSQLVSVTRQPLVSIPPVVSCCWGRTHRGLGERGNTRRGNPHRSDSGGSSDSDTSTVLVKMTLILPNTRFSLTSQSNKRNLEGSLFWWLVGCLVGLLVGWLVGWLVCWLMQSEIRGVKISTLFSRDFQIQIQEFGPVFV